jgi:hypothetical protein
VVKLTDFGKKQQNTDVKNLYLNKRAAWLSMQAALSAYFFASATASAGLLFL